MLAVSLAGVTRTLSGWSLRSSVTLKVIRAPRDAVMPTASFELVNTSVPRNMATTARMPVCAGSVRRTSTEPEENDFTSSVFFENTAVAAMLLGVSPAGTKTRLPSLTMTSSAASSKAKSRPVWLVNVSVCVRPCPKEPRAMMTAGLREMEGFSAGRMGTAGGAAFCVGTAGVAGAVCAWRAALKQSPESTRQLIRNNLKDDRIVQLGILFRHGSRDVDFKTVNQG